MRLLASDLQRLDIAQLDPEALGNVKKFSVSLIHPHAWGASSSFLVWLYLELSFGSELMLYT